MAITFLLIVFLSSIIFLWYRISLKIPQLVAIPDQVITERLYEDSARLRLFLLHLKTFYHEGRYKTVLLNFLGKLLYRVHIFLLRLDNKITSLLKKIRNGNGEGNGVINGSGEYWKQLSEVKEIKKEESLTSLSVITRIEEVRTKNKSDMPT